MLDFDMGAYGAYVWPAWGLSALALLLLVARTVAVSRRWRAEIRRLDGGESHA